MEPDDGVLKRGRTGNDLTTMSEDTRALLMSPGYVEVNQDPLGVPGRLLRIGDRSFAVVLWFRNQTQAVQHRTSRRLHSGSIERALIHLICVQSAARMSR